jgi:Holliday junction resolvase RusA-like endonuclease
MASGTLVASRVEFTVLGKPAPQGSKTVGSSSSGRRFVREDNPATAPWKATVAAAGRDAFEAVTRTDDGLLAGPLRLRVVFVFPRPAAHFGTGRNQGRLKPSAPLYCPTRPDLDKLLRAVGDALTGVVFRDDAQLVRVEAEKHYGEPPCAHVLVEELARG